MHALVAHNAIYLADHLGCHTAAHDFPEMADAVWTHGNI